MKYLQSVPLSVSSVKNLDLSSSIEALETEGTDITSIMNNIYSIIYQKKRHGYELNKIF